ncbi:MAG: hypothetical protein SVJ22_04615 [Halobacteriota archaeon]|nr:hypothetical protein [Halobacteriota archaeon]
MGLQENNLSVSKVVEKLKLINLRCFKDYEIEVENAMTFPLSISIFDSSIKISVLS